MRNKYSKHWQERGRGREGARGGRKGGGEGRVGGRERRGRGEGGRKGEEGARGGWEEGRGGGEGRVGGRERRGRGEGGRKGEGGREGERRIKLTMRGGTTSGQNVARFVNSWRVMWDVHVLGSTRSKATQLLALLVLQLGSHLRAHVQVNMDSLLPFCQSFPRFCHGADDLYLY